MRRRTAALVAAVGATSMVLAGCGSASDDDAGSAAKTLVVGIDLPMQGASKEASEATVNAMKLYLEQVGGKAGKYAIELKVYDDSTAAKGAWDETTCKKNAADHVANAAEVAVMGTYNSGCAALIIPVLNADPGGPMLMVSHANSATGLTKPWGEGEPDKYYPSGRRNFARVNPTDDADGVAFAQFAAKDLKVSRCYVLNDTQTYGVGVAKAFVAEAGKQGLEIVGNSAWDLRRPAYRDLFTEIKATNPDCVYLAGTPDNNGLQLIKDKVGVLGDNDTVKLLGPSGWLGYPDVDALPQAQGMYISGVSPDYLRTLGPASNAFLDAYKARYGAEIASPYAFYGAVALQVILAAIEKSDGSRASIRDAVFEGGGLTVGAATSLTGADVRIDPGTGDAAARDISVMQLTDSTHKLIKVVTV